MTYLVSTFVVLALLWVGYWYGANQIASSGLDRVTAAMSARGYEIECQDNIGGGFPFSLDLSCSRTSVAGHAGGLLAAINGFSATSPLYRPGRIESAAIGPLALDAPVNGLELTADWRKAETTVNADLSGLSAVATEVEELSVRVVPARHSLPFDGMALSTANFAISPGSDDDYHISALALAATLDMDGGKQLSGINIEGKFVALGFGGSLGLDPRQAIRDWVSNGGSLQVENLAITVETVATKYSGMLALSSDGTLSGDLKLTITGLEALPELVETLRPGSGEQVAQISSLIAAFTKPVDTPDGPSREMMLLVRDSIVSIGIIPIGVIPTIPL